MAVPYRKRPLAVHTTRVVRAQLPYVEAVLQEAMRLYPAASTLIREPPEDLDLGGGVVVPKWVQ